MTRKPIRKVKTEPKRVYGIRPLIKCGMRIMDTANEDDSGVLICYDERYSYYRKDDGSIGAADREFTAIVPRWPDDLRRKQSDCKESALVDQWRSCLSDPKLVPMLERLRKSAPATIAMPVIVHALIRSWDMCDGEDKIEIINECLGLDEDELKDHTIEFDRKRAEVSAK